VRLIVSLATTYVLRYGRYWSSTSASTAPVSVGAGIWAKTISRTLSGLARHACYRVQVVATNTAGTTTSKPVMVCTR
jgi:hypothetical protein